MPDMTKYRPLLDCIRAHYGDAVQVEKCREECAELDSALMGYPDVDRVDAVSEIADVLIMATQMAHLFGEAAVVQMIEYKLARQARRMGLEIESLSEVVS